MVEYCGKCNDTGKILRKINNFRFDRYGDYKRKTGYVTCPVCHGSSLERKMKDLDSDLETNINSSS